MERYRSFGPNDDPTLEDGDPGWRGVDQYSASENIEPGLAQSAVNLDFSEEDAGTRGGFVCLPELGNAAFGQTWSSVTPASSNNWQSIAFGGGIFVAVSASGTGNRVMTSPDGILWTSRTSSADAIWADVTWGNGLFVAVGNDGGTGVMVMTSFDGITWVNRTASSSHSWKGVAYGNGLFVAVATNAVMTSPDGIVWTDRTASSPDQWRAVAYGNSTYVAVAVTGGIMTSSDAFTWTDRTPVVTYAWTDIVFGLGLFVALGGAGIVETSPDGITWTARTAANSSTWFSIAYGNGFFAAVANAGAGDRVMTSQGGINWVSRTSPNQASTGVAFGNNLFVAVGNGVAMASTAIIFASGIYSDPADAGSQWIMLVTTSSVGFFAFGHTSRTVAIVSGQTVSEMSTVVQCNNLVYIARGADETPLYWTGDWSTEFVLAPTPTPAAGFEIIPNSNQMTYCQNRLWIPNNKDYVSASDVLDFTRFDQLANEFNINTGDSDFLVTTFPFGTTTLVVFKHKSVIALTAVDGALTDVVATEITRQVGAIGINSVCSVGADLVYVSDRNVNLLSLTSTSNALQHKTLPLSTKIKAIMQRVNWLAASKISMAYWDNKLYVALPLDNSTVCNTVAVYNFITEQWFGEWNFAAEIGIAIQGWAIATYLGATRLHCITEDGRILVTNEGHQDISGATVADIATSLTTRAYRFDNNNHVARRMYADLETNRPNFSVTAYTDGASESDEILTNQTYSRSKSWIFGDSTYDLTNASDDYNRAFRQDYSSTPADNVQPRSGFLPEMAQAFRFPILTRRKGRLAWVKIDNASGFISIKGIGVSARAGDRTSLVQVG